MVVGLAATLFVSSVHAAGAEESRVGDPCPAGSATVRIAPVPSRAYPALQAAVCAVRDGGVVFVRSGLSGMRATVWGKRVNLLGAGDDRYPSSWPTLRAPRVDGVVVAERAVGIVTVAARGALSVRRVGFVGGDAGILVHDRDGAANALDVQYSRFAKQSRGILMLSTAGLLVDHATFGSIFHNGISIYVPGECTKKIAVKNSDFIGIANVAVLIRDCQYLNAIDGLLLGLALQATSDLGGSGLLLVNSGPFVLDGLSISDAVGFGIAVIGSTAIVQNSSIVNTAERPTDEKFGDGIVAGALPAPFGPASLEVLNTFIYASQRAALSTFGSHLGVTDTTIGPAVFDLAAEDYLGFPYDLVDGGGNGCFDPVRACQADSPGIEAPEPLDIP